MADIAGPLTYLMVVGGGTLLVVVVALVTGIVWKRLTRLE